jgi:tetratricopeptide (TPR) repeat protein
LIAGSAPLRINARTTPYRNLAIINEYAGYIAASLRNFLAVIAIYDRLLERSPSNHNYRFSRAESQMAAANHSLKLHRIADAERLAREGISFLKEAARSPDASPVELVITARSLLECEVPAMRDYPLALTLVTRANAQPGDDSEMREVLAEAYWRNGNRDGAIHAIEKALSLIEQRPTPAREHLEKTLAEYRSGKLPAAARQR